MLISEIRKKGTWKRWRWGCIFEKNKKNEEKCLRECNKQVNTCNNTIQMMMWDNKTLFLYGFHPSLLWSWGCSHMGRQINVSNNLLNWTFLFSSQLNIVCIILEMETLVTCKGSSQIKKPKVKCKTTGTMLNWIFLLGSHFQSDNLSLIPYINYQEFF